MLSPAGKAFAGNGSNDKQKYDEVASPQALASVHKYLRICDLCKELVI